MSVAAVWEGVRIIVELVADLVARDAVVGCAVRGTGAECSFHGVCGIGGHTFDELSHLDGVVWGALAPWFEHPLTYSLLVEYDLQYLNTFPCVGREVFIECKYVMLPKPRRSFCCCGATEHMITP
jgi:hypothetical protein